LGLFLVPLIIGISIFLILEKPVKEIKYLTYTLLSLKGRPKNNGTIEGDIKFANLATFGGFAFKIKRTFPFSPNNKDTYLWVGAIPRGSKGIEKELSTSQKY